MKKINIYTDGACSGNPGKGGWCAYLEYVSKIKIITGNKKSTTNNEMELLAVINGIKILKEPCEINVYSDSAYIVNAFNQNWIENWINNNWINSKKQPVVNKNLWLDLIDLMNYHKINFIKVKGHSNNYKNNICDEYAKREILKI